MNPEDLAQILDDLGDRLGPSGQHVFELAVRQAIVVNGMWTAISVVATVIALTVAYRQIRGMRSLSAALDAYETTLGTTIAKVNETTDAIDKFKREKEEARLAAMTVKQRLGWFESGLPALTALGGSFWRHEPLPDVHEIRRANSERVWIAGIALVVAGFAGFIFLGCFPALVNPEYAAIRDILYAIR